MELIFLFWKDENTKCHKLLLNIFWKYRIVPSEILYIGGEDLKKTSWSNDSFAEWIFLFLCFGLSYIQIFIYLHASEKPRKKKFYRALLLFQLKKFYGIYWIQGILRSHNYAWIKNAFFRMTTIYCSLLSSNILMLTRFKWEIFFLHLILNEIQLKLKCILILSSSL